MTHRGEQFTKRVDFKEADDERQIATGVVMVPDKVDLQGDFERPETIREMSEGFMTRLSGDGAAEGGVMHAAFPGHSTLVENTVLDQSREIGGEEVAAGSWVQSWKFDDSELWTLVRDDILSGYSIGAENVRWSDPMEQEELPDDVDVAAGYPDEEPAYELEQGRVVEVSSVDIPAVPDAQILQTKDDSEKRVADYFGDREGFMRRWPSVATPRVRPNDSGRTSSAPSTRRTRTTMTTTSTRAGSPERRPTSAEGLALRQKKTAASSAPTSSA